MSPTLLTLVTHSHHNTIAVELGLPGKGQTFWNPTGFCWRGAWSAFLLGRVHHEFTWPAERYRGQLGYLKELLVIISESFGGLVSCWRDGDGHQECRSRVQMLVLFWRLEDSRLVTGFLGPVTRKIVYTGDLQSKRLERWLWVQTEWKVHRAAKWRIPREVECADLALRGQSREKY